MFILTLRSITLNGALIVGGTTIEVSDKFPLSEHVRQVAAPVVRVAAPARVAAAPVIPTGTVRIKSNITVSGQIVAAGTQFPPTAPQPTPTRTAIATSGNKQGSDEALYEVWSGTEWKTPTLTQTTGRSR
jgi:hypothetical protein